MLYPTELRGQAVVVAAGGFCQTDTLLARRAQVLVLFGSASRSIGQFCERFGPRTKWSRTERRREQGVTAAIHRLFLVEATLDAIRLST